MKHIISIIGAGRAGTALAVGLARGGYEIAVASQSFSSAQALAEKVGGEAYQDLTHATLRSDLIFITTPDDQIEAVATKIAEDKGVRSGSIIYHISGALSSQILLPCKELGAYIGSLHPLQSFADKEEGADNLPGSYFVVEGDEEASIQGEHIVAALKGKLLRITPEVKALYHAGACAASNYLVTVVALGTRLLEAAGIPSQVSLDALLPLIKGTVGNLEREGLPNALTGPISRGDIITLQTHFQAMSRHLPEFVDLYARLGKYTIDIGLAKGTIDAEEGLAIEALMEERGK